MAFKFKCKHCGEELIVYFLKKGEEAQCTACAKQATVPETAEFLESSKPEHLFRSNLLIKQDEERRRESTREELIRTPSVTIVKFVLDAVWYIGIVFISLVILGGLVGGVIDAGFFSDKVLELPITIRYHESPELIPWEGAECQSRGDGIVLLGHTDGFYQISEGNWPWSVVVDMILSAMFVMGATYFLRRIFRAIIGGIPFSKQNSVDLRRVGYIIAMWGPVYGTFNFMQGVYYVPYVGLANAHVSVELHWHPKLIIVGMVIIVIAHLFELATRIQQENELTI